MANNYRKTMGGFGLIARIIRPSKMDLSFILGFSGGMIIIYLVKKTSYWIKENLSLDYWIKEKKDQTIK